MAGSVDITFDCLPLRSIPRLDVPLDAPAEAEGLARRIRLAATKHGLHNSYYLCNAHCVFQLTNDPEVGRLDFSFEGTVLTDAEDRHTVGTDLAVTLGAETCDWLIHPVVNWFRETVNRAVAVEFDRFVQQGDLARTLQRIAKLQAQSDALGGFLGMGL
jgi:hypothetical protein